MLFLLLFFSLKAINFLQVRFAETQVEKENKLFVGMLPKTFNEHELRQLFQPFGELKEVHIIRGPEGSPKGCAFVKFVDRDAAMSAINQLNETIPTVSFNMYSEYLYFCFRRDVL